MRKRKPPEVIHNQKSLRFAVLYTVVFIISFSLVLLTIQKDRGVLFSISAPCSLLSLILLRKNLRFAKAARLTKKNVRFVLSVFHDYEVPWKELEMVAPEDPYPSMFKMKFLLQSGLIFRQKDYYLFRLKANSPLHSLSFMKDPFPSMGLLPVPRTEEAKKFIPERFFPKEKVNLPESI